MRLNGPLASSGLIELESLCHCYFVQTSLNQIKISSRNLRWRLLEILAGIGFVGGAAIVLWAVRPTWDKLSRLPEYKVVSVTVEEIDVGGWPTQWIGHGQVDGRDLVFQRGELDALFGAPPPQPGAAVIEQLRPQLPIHSKARWNPEALCRLLPTKISRDVLAEKLRFKFYLFFGFFVIGFLAIFFRIRN